MGNSVTAAPRRDMMSRMSRPNCPATTTSTGSPGSITDAAPASRAVRPEPGRRMTSFCVWKTSRSARVVGSSTPSSKLASYWIVGGWFMAWMTGWGSSVGPGIMRTGRVCGTAQLRSEGTAASFPEGGVRVVMGRSARRARLRARRSVDEVEIAGVDQEPGRLPENEDGVQSVDGVGEQGHAAPHRPVPELDGNHALPRPLGGDPLHDEPRGEEGLPHQPHPQPHLIDCHRAFLRCQGFSWNIARRTP